MSADSTRTAVLRLTALWLLPGPLVSTLAADSLETVQRTAADWARLRAETVRLESEWEWQRELLTSTLTALQERTRALEDRRDLLQAQTGQLQREFEELSAKTEAAAATMKQIEARLDVFTRRLVALRPFLPPRLSEALDLPYRTLTDATLPPSERIQSVVTILARAAQFNRTITYSEEPLALETAAAPRLLEIVYWGLSHAYALDRVSHRAYVGAPSATGWVWQPRPEINLQVDRLVTIYKDRSEPAFIEVPAQLTTATLPGGAR